MAFQFQCPQGHLLEGDESQAGQTCQCPTCGMAFIIPAPLAPAYEPEPEPQHQQPAFPQMGFGGPAGYGGPAMPAVDQPPPLLHIPCPNGHELETPPEMLEQEVMCPHCNAQFKLRERDSVEFKRKKQEEEDRRIARSGKLWFNWSVTIAVLIVIFLVILIAVQAGK